MNRRSMLGLLGLAPIAAPAAVKAALAEPPMALGRTSLKGAGGAAYLTGATLISAEQIAAGSITAEHIRAGSISVSELHWSQIRHHAIDPHFDAEDKLVGALGFGA